MFGDDIGHPDSFINRNITPLEASVDGHISVGEVAGDGPVGDVGAASDGQIGFSAICCPLVDILW